MACVYVYVIILTFVGPEHLRRSFDVDHDEDVREVAGDEFFAEAERHGHHNLRGTSSDDVEGGVGSHGAQAEKVAVSHH